MKSVALHNLGCKVNGYEIDVMQQMLQEKGYAIVPFDQKADIYIINTCTVTNIADRKSRQMLHRAKKMNPDAVVVAIGCYVQTGEEAVRKDESIDLAIGNNRKKDIVSILEEYLKNREEATMNRENDKSRSSEPDAKIPHCDIIDINHTDEYEEMTLQKTAENTRAYIKIQDGCNQFCTYCIIPYARGRVRSRREEDILHEVKGMVAAGYKEIVLTGIHISSYGVDQKGAALLPLIMQLHDIEGLERIRLGSLEPRIVNDEFVRTISSLQKLCPHFHLSMQSGCDSVLKRMNRRYDSGEYFEKVTLIRKYYERPAITTDVIVGFPGETEEEFRMTKEFVQKVRFAQMHVFKYSKRRGTLAAQMPQQLTEAQKAIRSDELLELEAQMADDYRRLFVGEKIRVLFEEEKVIDGSAYWIGHTPEYVRVAKKATAKENLRNRIVEGNAIQFLTKDLLLME